MASCEYCGKELTSRGRSYCSHACANKGRREQERRERRTYTVWCCGGGVQSTAIAALIYTGKIPKPDYSVMVDTGYEKSAVMSYVRNTIIPNLARMGVKLNIIRTSDYCEQSIVDADGYCIIPAFKKTGDKAQLLKTCCNDKWKTGVIRKWLLSLGVEQYISLLGISTDEAHRQCKAHKKYYENIYPLIKLGMDRQACIDYITGIGWPEPPRSSCYICGQQTDGEWWRLVIQHPEDFRKAVSVERQMRKVCGDIYLHRSCKPLDTVFKL